MASVCKSIHIIPMTHDPVQDLQTQLRNDLRAAMRARKSADVSLLRTLIAAIDNAQAVPVGDLHATYVVRAFGDDAVEVARRPLSREDLFALLQREIDDRMAAANEFSRTGHIERAAALAREAAIVGHYLNLVRMV